MHLVVEIGRRSQIWSLEMHVRKTARVMVKQNCGGEHRKGFHQQGTAAGELLGHMALTVISDGNK